MDRDAQPSPQNAAKPKRSRSPIERVVTWSFITLLLVVVGIEAHARLGHDRTVRQLQADLADAEKTGAELNLAAARQKVSGLPFQTDKRVNDKGRLTYRWPSLFKTYVVNLSLVAGEVVVALDTDADADGPIEVESDPDGMKAVIAAAQQPVRGFAQPLKGVVALATSDVAVPGRPYETDPAKLTIVPGVLVRELIRQAFLLAAHEELQQNVLDESLGEDVGSDAQPQESPYDIESGIQSNGLLTIRIIKRVAGQRSTRRELEPFQLDPARFYESLLAHVEEVSRTTFPTVLREMGVSGQANTFRETAEVPPDIAARLHRIDEMSQLTAARELHALIRRDGESPERLAALSRAYANLGSLTDNHWRFHHKVFKARALLYAQRLVTAAKSSPWAVAHRGYAWALTGRLNTASEDFQQAATARLEAGQEAAFPRWITDARSYCDYELAPLQAAEGDGKALAAYLRVLLTNPNLGKTEFLDAAKAFIAASRGCARGMFVVGEVEELGAQRMVADEGFQNSWPAIYQTLVSVPDLPPEAAALIKKHAEDEFVLDDELEDRARLIRILKSAPDAGSGPNPFVYGLLLEEITFLQATYRIRVAQFWLGVPSDDIVRQVAPTLQGHPYAAFLLSKVSDPNESRAKFQEFLKSLRSTDLDLNAMPVLTDAYRTDPRVYSDLWTNKVRHLDLIQPDLVGELQYNLDGPRSKLVVHFLNVVAPRLPQSVASRISVEGLKDAEEAKQLEARYDQNPHVLGEIAGWYARRSEDDDALRCLKRRVEIAPEIRTFRTLAAIYAKKNDRAQWKSTLLAALELPSLGLEHAQIQKDLAYYHMHRNELKEALPFAEAAAETFSGWGLECAARCYERMGRMEEAEALLSACSQRYDESSFEWLFWCLRTGQGDERAAREYAMEMLEKRRQASDLNKGDLAVYYLTEKDPAAALAIFKESASRIEDSYLRLHAALLADVTGEKKLRNEYLSRIRYSGTSDWAYADLADLMAGSLAQPDPVQWNEEEFRRLLSKCDDGEATNFYYFAGRFLVLHGQPDLGTEYLKLAASSPEFYLSNCLLAAVELRERGVEIPACRSSELGGELADLSRVKDEIRDCSTARQHDRIVELITQGLADHPQWEFLLVDRGVTYERLGKNQEAIADYERALERNPDSQPAHHELAMIRGACEDAALRDPAQALIHAQKAFDLAFTKTYLNHTCLAIAFAANGDFEKAVEHQKLAVQNWPYEFQSVGQERLKLFQEQKPYVREPRKP